MMSRRARATRMRSTCASAIWRARPISSGSWHPGAISSAMNATSALTLGSYITSTLRPCLRAFCAERALPAAEVGPVPAGLPTRLARSLRLLIPAMLEYDQNALVALTPPPLPSPPPAASGAVMRRPALARHPRTRRRWPRWRGTGPARRLSGASGFRATRRRGAPGDDDHAIDALDIVDAGSKRLRHHGIEGQAGPAEQPLDLARGFLVAQGPLPAELFGARPIDDRRQQPFDPLICVRLQQLRFEAAQPDAVPHQIGDVAHPDVFHEIGGGDIGGNPLQDHVVIGPVLSVDQRPRPEQRQARRAGGRGG